MDGSSNEWQEGPGLVASVWRYRWLVAVAVLVGGLAAYAWSSRQPVRYEGVIRVFLDTRDEQTSDAGRVVRSQAEFLASPAVLHRATALIDHRLTSKKLRDRLTVEPVTGADVITIKVLDATPRGAAELANTVVRAYREVLTEQRTSGARQEVAALERRQRQLDGEIAELDDQLRVQSGNELLQATRQAKIRLLETLADQVEAARRSARSSGTMESAREEAAVPDEPAQPKPLRTTAIGALLAFVVAAGLAWWLSGRRPDLERQGASHGLGGISGQERTGLDMSSPVRLAARFDDGRTVSSNGSPTGNGAVSGIADFDQIATSIQRLFHFLNGPSQRLYEDNLPQLTVEEIAHRFKIDMAAILLDNAGEVQTMGSVGLRASRTGTIDSGVRHLIEAAVRSGPRLVDHDELVRLSGMGLGGDQADSLALVPLVRDEIGFGVLLAGRRHGGTPLSDREVGEIADCIDDIVPYVWAWLLLRNLKLRLRTLQ
jgi:uncharacterized protein involved in exopolysaccharide biosynthesis